MHVSCAALLQIKFINAVETTQEHALEENKATQYSISASQAGD